MSSSFLRFAAIAFFLDSTGTAAAATISPWGDLAKQDLQAVRDLLEENHPGPVDPLNPGYRQWLGAGLAQATTLAGSAASYADYVKAIRFYTNGFRDGHIGVSFTMTPNNFWWPRFLVHNRPGETVARVGTAVDNSQVPVGAQLLSCDGKTVSALLEDRLDPYFWNRDLPHTRMASSPRLFMLQPGEADLRFKRCKFEIDGQERTIDLQWSSDPWQTLADHWTTMSFQVGQPSLELKNGIWFIKLPSFSYSGASAEPIKALIEEVREKAPELRRATVVLDVRGNGGGNSAWGAEIASALWSREHVERVTRGFDWTVDWRVSKSNVEHLTAIAEQNERDGLTDAATSWRKAAEMMKAALARGEELVRVPNPPQEPHGEIPPNPIQGKVYLLTDTYCASACLDFADLVRRLPGTTHIGMPTNADAVYIDNTYAALPSGLAGLSYSLKVYRNRVRGNNEWYEPDLRWPGGEMTDEALVAWIDSLKSR